MPRRDFLPMYPVTIDAVGVQRLIHNLKLSSCCGVDEINPKFLKNTELFSSIFLSLVFSQSIQCSTLPLDWKVGKVVPLHKSGNTQSPLNYRPISLTSVPCKLLEHIIYSNIVSFLESNSFFTPFQHGFRKHYSCETQLLYFTNDIASALDRGSLVHCIFLDFQKAFDTVPHQLLLLKISTLNIDPNILKWIECFLTYRTQFVTTNDYDSPLSKVTSGVPQGSVLGPLLFLIYINDLPDHINSSIRLFADDCVLYREITQESDISLLQTDLQTISTWCNKWLMTLNSNKSKCMTITRRSTSPSCSYSINAVPLQHVTSYKYLVVHITNNLSWQTHINYICSNANRTLGYLRRNFSNAPLSLKILLYRSLVRPKLEYASAIWDPAQQNLITALESVQNRSARFISSNYSRTASVSKMKSDLELPNLTVRRKLARLHFFHKIFFHNPSIRRELISQPSYHSSRIDHQYKVAVPFCRTELFSACFLPRTCADWNHLPSSIVSIQDASKFKSVITQHFL